MKSLSYVAAQRHHDESLECAEVWERHPRSVVNVSSACSRGSFNYELGLQDQGRPLRLHSVTERLPSPSKSGSRDGVVKSRIDYVSNVRSPKVSPRRRLQSALGRKSMLNYSRGLAADRSRFSAAKFAREKAVILEKIRSLAPPQLTGWRAKLAKEGFDPTSGKMAETSEFQQLRLWNYVDTDDDTPDSERYIFVICRATQTRGDEMTGIAGQRNVSRLRKMQLEMRSSDVCSRSVAVQVVLNERNGTLAERDGQSSSSYYRSTSWYRNGSYGKYVTPVPWSSTRDSSLIDSSGFGSRSVLSFRRYSGKASNADGVESHLSENVQDKSYRKSLLNMNLPDTRSGPVDTVDYRRKRMERLKKHVSSTSSEGYESLSSVIPEEKPDLRLSPCSISSESTEEPELNFSDDVSTKEPSPCSDSASVKNSPNTGSHYHFRTATNSSSQRDSGFLELCSRCDSDAAAAEDLEPQKNFRSANKFGFGEFRGIENTGVLRCDLSDDQSRGKDFDTKFEVQVEPWNRTCFDPVASQWTEYLKSSGHYKKINATLSESDSSSGSDDDQKHHRFEASYCSDEVDRSAVAAPRAELSDRLKNELDDCTLQLYRYNNGSGEGDYGSYLDLESTVDEQAEEFEGFHDNRKNAVILRTQLSVRVHAIIEKLVNSSGRELRRALFSLKQIFQDDKDLVHEFVQNDGLACLIKVGSEADQNYQNYILRALGQVMLYVDGMNGVIEHNETIQWLYSLIASKYRLVVKTALKLLLVFVEYTESNCQLLINAVSVVDADNGSLPWSNIMNLLKEKDSADMELLVYAATLINKTLNGIPDQDTYYDVVDVLEEQGMEHVIQYYMSKQGTDLDLLQQFQIYEAVMKYEDGVPDNKTLPLDAQLRQVPRSRKSYPGENDRRKSRRHSVDTLSSNNQNKLFNNSLEKTPEESPFLWEDNRNHRIKEGVKNNFNHELLHMNGNTEHISVEDENGITPALRRRRRERDARNKSFIKEQEQSRKENNKNQRNSLSSVSSACSDNSESSTLVTEEKSFQSMVERRRSCFENGVDIQNQKNLAKTKCDQTPERELDSNNVSDSQRPNYHPFAKSDTNKKAWMFSMMYSKSQDEENCLSKPHDIIRRSLSPMDSLNNNFVSYNKMKDEGSVSNLRKDLQVKCTPRYENGFKSPSPENLSRLGDTSGIISRAKEGLVASSTRSELKPSSPSESPSSKIPLEPRKLDNDLQWEQLMKSMKRPLVINDLDFTDLGTEEDVDILVNGDASHIDKQQESSPLPPSSVVGLPPPPPPLPMGAGPVPPPPPPEEPMKRSLMFSSKPANANSSAPSWMRRNLHQLQESSNDSRGKTVQKTKKTVKLFWKEVKEDRTLLQRIGKKKTIWDELKPVPVDTQKLEHLFENRGKDIISKEKVQENNKKNEIIVLDTKRSNAINIGMTKLPPPRTIKTAIFKMDNTIMNREGIEKILAMLPTEDEKSRIAEAQMANPDVPLGSAEQFLLTLSSISELEARLRLWAFRLDYESIEREVAEPLMDLKQAVKEIESSETFRVILSTLRSIGNFLNGVEIKGFHIEYLSKVPEVKDTVHKHSLLHHVCHLVMEKFPKSTDLYSEIGAVTRASKVDYNEVSRNLNKMESECKASWDYLKAIAKHDCSVTMKVRTSEFLTDCAERIIVLKVIHRRMMNRYRKFLVYLGFSSITKDDTKDDLSVQNVCKVLSEFALEYRTTRERVLQQIEKKANHRERNKTRGKMITDMEKFRTKEQQADHELRQLLGNGSVGGDEQKIQKWGTVPGIRGRVKANPAPGGSLGRHSAPVKDEGLTDGDDEILETLVKTATAQPSKNEPRIRKKARYGDRKSLRRTLKNGLSEEERRVLSTIAT